MRVPALERQIATQPIEFVLELPTERDITAYASLRYACECDDEYSVGVRFDSFRNGDAAGWYFYIDSVFSSRATAV